MTNEQRIENYIKKLLSYMPTENQPNQISLISHYLAKEGFFIPSTKIGNKAWYLDIPKNRKDLVRVVPSTILSYKLISSAEKQEEISKVYFIDSNGNPKYAEGVISETLFLDKREAEQKADHLNSLKTRHII